MNNRYLILLLFVVVGINNLWSQEIEWQPLTREIVINTGDTMVRARIVINSEKIKPSQELIYYWFNNGLINRNMGGYSGKLLHGSYQVFDKWQTMVVQGDFNMGLRDGEWKYWYTNGNLKRIESWKKGKKSNKVILFDEQGKLLKQEVFHEKSSKRNAKDKETIESLIDTIPAPINQME